MRERLRPELVSVPTQEYLAYVSVPCDLLCLSKREVWIGYPGQARDGLDRKREIIAKWRQTAERERERLQCFGKLCQANFVLLTTNRLVTKRTTHQSSRRLFDIC